MAKLVVVGDFNADIVLYFDRFPKPGETINAKRFFEGPGGKGSNQAIAAARLGAEVTFVGAIGNDHYGRIAQAAWDDAGVDTSLVLRSDSESTAVAMIYVDAAGDNTIGVNQAANLTLEPAGIEAIAETIGAADVLMCTLGVSIEVVGRALSVAKHSGTTTLLNPAPAATLPRSLLDAADYITPNEHELAEMVGGDRGDGGDQADADVVAHARRLLSRDDQTAVVTLGRAGARWVTSSATEQIGAFSVEAIDTVGAGDAFNAALAGRDSPRRRRSARRFRFANAAAALSVTRQGARGRHADARGVRGIPAEPSRMTILPGLTSTEKDRIPGFVRDLRASEVREIALFPTVLDKAERAELYGELASISGLRLARTFTANRLRCRGDADARRPVRYSLLQHSPREEHAPLRRGAASCRDHGVRGERPDRARGR